MLITRIVNCIIMNLWTVGRYYIFLQKFAYCCCEFDLYFGKIRFQFIIHIDDEYFHYISEI